MKNIIVIVLLTILSQGVFAQEASKPKKEIKTIEFKVKGNCDQCKKRIENAASIKGVKSTLWNEETQVLKVIFRTDKATEMQIHEAVAKSGHATDKVAKDTAVYNELPECCKYDDRKHQK